MTKCQCGKSEANREEKNHGDTRLTGAKHTFEAVMKMIFPHIIQLVLQRLHLFHEDSLDRDVDHVVDELARAVFHGKRGELCQRYRKGQEDQLGALGLVVNIIILWNTLYINAAVEQLANDNYPVQPQSAQMLPCEKCV